MLARAIILTAILLLAGCASGSNLTPEQRAQRQNAALIWSTAFQGMGQAYYNRAAVQRNSYNDFMQLQQNQAVEHIKNFGIPRSY